LATEIVLGSNTDHELHSVPEFLPEMPFPEGNWLLVLVFFTAMGFWFFFLNCATWWYRKKRDNHRRIRLI
jgi:hypothetical protein